MITPNPNLLRIDIMYERSMLEKRAAHAGKRVGLSVGKRARVPRGYVQVLYDIRMNVLSVGKWINGRENLV